MDVIVVTGAASGIGPAVAVRLAKRRSTFWLVDREIEGLAATAAAVRKERAIPVQFEADVTQGQQLRQMVSEVERAGDRIGNVVACAGVAGATLEMKLQYLRPLKAGTASCIAKFLQRGKSIAFLESRLTDANGNLAVVATSTWKCNSVPNPATADVSR